MKLNVRADQVLSDQGDPGQDAAVTITCRAPQGNCHVGTSVITVRVDTAVVLPLSPQILGQKVATFALSATHTVPIGQYVESAPDAGRDDRTGTDDDQ